MRFVTSLSSKVILGLLVIVMFTISCAETVPLSLSISVKNYGFWHGVLHGLILPFSFIGSLFDDSIAIYAINNIGSWYDFGFVFGASIIFGGSGKGSSRRKKKD